MQLRVFTEPQQGASYDDLLRVAQRAEECGYDAFFRSDHFLKMGDVSGEPGPTDAWITLAGLARETSTIRLGTLMSAATFRLPGPLAIAVAQVDQMSGGRIELGLGSGWYEQEHAAYGIGFGSLRERFDRYAEQLAIITGLWATGEGDTFSYDGEYYQLTEAPPLVRPAQSPHPPILIGGSGAKRTPRLAARYADEFNVPFAGVDDTARLFAGVRAACEQAGRDPESVRYSAAQVLCCGRTEAQLRDRAAAIGRELSELRANGLAGTPAELVDKIGTFARAGAGRMYLQTLDLSDLDHLDLVASEVLPQVASL
ncbi:LLM class F420-dependent oxidoreductase [Actinocatenispora thailandica]|uniref:LLM class F420-dependent oxidoreductase n=1 Tax=Actinocatenispora thailandica TaxID=227318 RepID=A0A7R7DNJ2_9ACTN|nr:LLM class F420-dependent oxidoreductase [Actinocatenispora thailandica]BCJ34904.1 LLM class F420-dependent oxidoreductase [Actinocatenispora thailandica]